MPAPNHSANNGVSDPKVGATLAIELRRIVGRRHPDQTGFSNPIDNAIKYRHSTGTPLCA
jgi:hypothetical protein